jgi:hypothetical protein
MMTLDSINVQSCKPIVEPDVTVRFSARPKGETLKEPRPCKNAQKQPSEGMRNQKTITFGIIIISFVMQLPAVKK